jgi:hypothetical protein
VVVIKRNTHGNNPKYFVYHSHPAPDGRAVMQEPEGAMSMGSARAKCEKHLKHWSKSILWQADPDFARVGKRGE